MKTFRFLVTGATSSLGLAVGRRIRSLSHHTTGTTRTKHHGVAPSIFDSLVCIDLEDHSTIDALKENYDAIIHIAAVSHGSPERLIRVTGEGTRVLIEKAISLGIPKFVLVSGISVYGQVSVPVITADTPISHGSPYGAAKWIAECSLNAARHRISGISVRSPAIVGPQVSTHSHFLARVYARMLSGTKTCELSNPDFRFNNVIHEDTLADFLVSLALSDMQDFQYCPVGSVPDEPLEHIINRIAKHTRYRGTVAWVAPTSPPFSIGLEDATRLGFRPISTSETLRRWLI